MFCLILLTVFRLQVLRFSRLFPPQYPISIYRKKKKPDDGSGADKLSPVAAVSSREAEMNWGEPAPPDLIMKDEQVNRRRLAAILYIAAATTHKLSQSYTLLLLVTIVIA